MPLSSLQMLPAAPLNLFSSSRRPCRTRSGWLSSLSIKRHSTFFPVSFALWKTFESLSCEKSLEKKSSDVAGSTTEVGGGGVSASEADRAQEIRVGRRQRTCLVQRSTLFFEWVRGRGGSAGRLIVAMNSRSDTGAWRIRPPTLGWLVCV